jgi:hypothetical protein
MNCKQCKFWLPALSNTGSCTSLEAQTGFTELLISNSIYDYKIEFTPENFGCCFYQQLTRFNFDELWSLYPRKLGKDAAKKHFTAQIKTQKEFDMLAAAVRFYAAECKSKKTAEQYIMQGKTFFNSNWKDYYEASLANTNTQKKEFHYFKGED